MQSTTFRTVAELSRALAAREVSAVELAQDYLARIEAHKELNCFLDVRPEVTLEQAREADKRIAEGTATRLTGHSYCAQRHFCDAQVGVNCRKPHA